MNILHRLKAYIKQEVADIYTSHNWVLTIRTLTILLSLFFLLQSVPYLLYDYLLHGLISVASSAVYLICFRLTYRHTINYANYLLGITIVCWILFCVGVSGWDTGVQHFLFLLVILVFFADYGNIKEKLFLVFLLYLARIGLYFYCKNFLPLIPLNDIIITIMQVNNTSLIFISITIVTLFFHNKSYKMEEKLIEYSKELESEANRDSLTGLYNRRMLNSYIKSCIQKFYLNQESFSIAIGDIDFFKKINDTYGHDFGDFVLHELAILLTSSLYRSGQVFRFGGEEFILVFRDMNGDKAIAFLSDLLQVIRDKIFQKNNISIKVHMTFGIAEYDNTLDLAENIKIIDKLLYYGKETGRNKIVY